MKYNFPIEIKLYFEFDVFKNKLKMQNTMSYHVPQPYVGVASHFH